MIIELFKTSLEEMMERQEFQAACKLMGTELAMELAKKAAKYYECLKNKPNIIHYPMEAASKALNEGIHWATTPGGTKNWEEFFTTGCKLMMIKTDLESAKTEKDPDEEKKLKITKLEREEKESLELMRAIMDRIKTAPKSI
jgi:hypothetical protein